MQTLDVVISVVVPVFNEESAITAFLSQLRSVLDSMNRSYEVVLVDDGSKDRTFELATMVSWRELRVVQLATNVGHQAAIDAGLSIARGVWIITMDGDGQHPPEAIVRMLQAAELNDSDVVYGVRTSRELDTAVKRLWARWYYRVVRWLTNVPMGDNQADFRLISMRALKQIDRVPGDRVLRLLLPSIGFRSEVVMYESMPRISGHGRFGISRQLSLATSSILDFSSKPLKMVAAIGSLLSLSALLWLTYVLATFALGRSVEGWASVMAAVLFVGGLTLLSLSVIGSYVARIHDILKARPRFFIQKIHN
jgi:dolichol-phosphate mannosyltransferase